MVSANRQAKGLTGWPGCICAATTLQAGALVADSLVAASGADIGFINVRVALFIVR